MSYVKTDWVDDVSFVDEEHMDKIEQGIFDAHELIANIPSGDTGPQGPPGPTGATGAQGPTGPAGADGSDGADGAPGVMGPPGATGATGPQGPQGEPGTGFVLQGTVPTVGDLPLTGVEGDAWMVEATGDVWIWDTADAQWENAGPIQGPPGPQGEPGVSAGKILYYAASDPSDIATYKTLGTAPSLAAENTLAVACSGTSDVLVAAFATDPGAIGEVDYPAGTAYRRIFAMVNRGTARLHLLVYSRNEAGVETLVRDEFSPAFGDTAVAMQEWLSTPPNAGHLLATDRIVNKLYAQRVSGTAPVTVTVYFEGTTHESQIQTTISTGAVGPPGPTGPTGATGPTGPQGIQGVPGPGYTILDAAGDMIVASGPDTEAKLAAPGTTGHVITADLALPNKVKWAAPTDDIPKSLIDAAGDLIVGSANDVAARHPAPTVDGHVLTADTSLANKVKWAAAAGGVTLRKTSVKDVVNTVVDTDLLNGEITIPAGAMSTDRLLRAVLIGDFFNNSGAGRTLQLKVKIGGTTFYDHVSASIAVNATVRYPFAVELYLGMQGASNLWVANGKWSLGAIGPPTTGIGDLGTLGKTSASGFNNQVSHFGFNGTLDFASSRLFEITVIHAAANANLSLRCTFAHFEIK